MKVRPGRNLIRVGVAFLAVAPLNFFFPQLVWLPLILIVPVIIVAFADRAALKQSFRNVSVHRRVQAVVRRGETFPVELQVENRSSRPLLGELRDGTPPFAAPRHAIHPLQVPPHGQKTLRTELSIPVRGRYEFGPVWLRLNGRFGILEGQEAIPRTAEVKVLPETFGSSEGLQKDIAAELLMLDKQRWSRHRGTGAEFESLDEYREGDDPRKIDWRTTARHRRPIVRRYHVERHRDVMVLIDCGRLMGAEVGRAMKLDFAVDSGLMLSRVALEYGDRCGMGLFDDQVRVYISPVAGIASLRILSDHMFDARSRWRESDFSRMFSMLQTRRLKRSLIVILSDIVDVETTERFRASLARLAQRHVVLFAALRTPLMEEIVKSPVGSGLDGARKAVVFRLLREREQALHSLRRSDVHVLDVAPQQLTIPLINQFLELRQRNLL